ncbi:hypothetical protein IJI76_03610 [Candidatus Saccharibacteria bacterium]|nr:hypothetical protein [Candidatus Saccharibacteria bacterium]
MGRLEGGRSWMKVAAGATTAYYLNSKYDTNGTAHFFYSTSNRSYGIAIRCVRIENPNALLEIPGTHVTVVPSPIRETRAAPLFGPTSNW